MAQQLDNVLVIGGGVIGAACAYFLSKAGCRVTVVDQGEFGRGCSHGNCGYVSPSHVFPLAEPGAVRKALRSLMSRDSPLSIRPRLDPGLWAWLLRFALRCNRRHMMEAGRACHALLISSADLYREILAAENMAEECEWTENGLLFAFASPAAMELYGVTDRLLNDQFQLPARRYDGEQLVELEPALKPGLAGGWFYDVDSHLRPDRLMTAWRRVLGERQVAIREHCRISGFATEGGKAKAAVTDAGQQLDADAFVIAAGALTPLLGKHLGCRLPIQPGKGYSITMPRPSICPRIPMLLPEFKVGVTPMRTGYRLGSTMEFAGYDTRLNQRRLALLRRGAEVFLKEPYCEPVEEQWYGWRPMTYDGVPIIDRSPRLNNVMIAAGHNMLGVSMSPGTGRLVAELLTEQAPHLDAGPYRVARFTKRFQRSR